MPATELSPEIWTIIARFLTANELSVFQRVCGFFNAIGRANALWQPFVNRLKAIDRDLEINARTTLAAAQIFAVHFRRLSEQQHYEINIFYQLSVNRKIDISPDNLAKLQAINTPATKLHILEERNALLTPLMKY